MAEMSAEQYVHGHFQLQEAADRIDRAKELANKHDSIPSTTIKYVITDGQLVIETATKCIFSFLGFQYPREHGISFTHNSSKSLLSKVLKSKEFGFDRKEEIPRSIFLTQFWSHFYTLAKYGVPEQGLLPGDLFNDEDVERIISDAEFCVELALDLDKHQYKQFRREHEHHPEDYVQMRRRNLDLDSNHDADE